MDYASSTYEEIAMLLQSVNWHNTEYPDKAPNYLS
jgi:hypothetical protein